VLFYSRLPLNCPSPVISCALIEKMNDSKKQIQGLGNSCFSKAAKRKKEVT